MESAIIAYFRGWSLADDEIPLPGTQKTPLSRVRMLAAEPVLVLSPGPERPGLLALGQCLSLGKLHRPAVALPEVVAASLAG